MVRVSARRPTASQDSAQRGSYNSSRTATTSASRGTGEGYAVRPYAPSVQDAPAIAWRWSAALPGALFAIPAAIVTLRDPSVGLALAYGAVPAAAVGITPTRRSRHVIVVVGACIGLSLVLEQP